MVRSGGSTTVSLSWVPFSPSEGVMCCFGKVFSDLGGYCGLLYPFREKGVCFGKGIVPSTYSELKEKLAIARINPLCTFSNGLGDPN